VNALVLMLSLIVTQTPVANDNESARQSFQLGVESRNDSRIARPHFATAAREYRQFWERDERSPELAQSWARSEFLAGNLPQAVATAHAGLRLAPHHAGLQRDLETYRDSVAPQLSTKPEEQLRPARLAGVRSRISGWDLFWIAAGASLIVGVGLSRRFTSGGSWAVPLALVGVIGGIACAGLATTRALEVSEDRAVTLWVLRTDEPLRKGNGESHAMRLGAALPLGTELREVGQRGGWIQVQLTGGAIGWLPERTLLPVP
jgi:hypothetical protein